MADSDNDSERPDGDDMAPEPVAGAHMPGDTEAPVAGAPGDAVQPESPHETGVNGELEPAGESEPQSAFDALPEPEPTDLPQPDAAYQEWPYADRGSSHDEPPPVRPIEPVAEPENPEDAPRGDMGFFDHLEELRSRIIKAILGLVVAAIIAAVFSDFIIQEILLRPARVAKVNLQNINPMGQLTLTLQVLLVSGLIISIPWIIWQFWQFVRPGLYPKERRYSSWIAVATIFCFLLGVTFAYFVMVPTSLEFASGFVYEGIVNFWAISEYFSFVLGFILACGVVFEMPMLAFALGRFGILTPAFMRHYRRHAAVVILITSAIITPTPDPFNQLILAVPLYGLFEISILVSAVAARKRDEAYSEQFGDEDIENTADQQ
jgi:sec-independent protein translocase protein TatC